MEIYILDLRNSWIILKSKYRAIKRDGLCLPFI